MHDTTYTPLPGSPTGSGGNEGNRHQPSGCHKSCRGDRHQLQLDQIRDRHASSARESHVLPPQWVPNTTLYPRRPLETYPEESKGLSPNFDVDDRGSGELPHYKDGEYPESRERTPLQKGRVRWIIGVFVASILVASFHAQMLRNWCAGMGVMNRPTNPSKLLSNGTHEFKLTVLIVSIDGLR